MAFDSNLSSIELVDVLRGIDTRIGILKEDDSFPAIVERQDLFQKHEMVLTILDNRYEEEKLHVVNGFLSNITL